MKARSTSSCTCLDTQLQQLQQLGVCARECPFLRVTFPWTVASSPGQELLSDQQPTTSNQTTNNQQPTTTNNNSNNRCLCASVPCLFVVSWLMADRVTGVAMRRRQRRLRSWWRHEQQSIAAALATSLHHSSRGQKKARAEEEESELHYTDKDRKTPPPQPVLFKLFDEEPGGGRPEAFVEPRPQERVLRHTAEQIGDVAPVVPALGVPEPPMTTLGHSFVLQGDARSGGTSSWATPSGTHRGSHRRARAGYKYWPPWWRAMLGSTLDTHTLRQLEEVLWTNFTLFLREWVDSGS